MNSAKGKLIVSLTTLPDRLEKLKIVLRNLQFQTKLPDLTLLYLPERCRRNNQEYILPQWLKDDRITRPINLEIIRIPVDYGPFTKLFPALRDFFSKPGDDIIITIDDDNLLEDHTLEELYNASRANPGIVMAMMVAEGNNFIHAEHLYDRKENYHLVKKGNIGGYRSVCYPQSAITNEIVDEIIHHYSEISELHHDLPYPVLDDDHLVGNLLYYLHIPLAVIKTNHPGNLASKNILEQINITMFKNFDGVNNGSQAIGNSRQLVDVYFSSLLESRPRTPDRKVYDVFMFNGEYDLLELRFLEHDEFVERFFLVESKYTFTGLEKELYYEKQKDRYKKWHHKIEYLIIDEIPLPYKTPDDRKSWEREFYCRSYAGKYITSTCNENDLVVISDLDEIINPDVGNKMKFYQDFPPTKDCYSLVLDFYYYNCNWIKPKPWYMSVAAPVAHLNEKSLQEIRAYHLHYKPIYNSGWHLSFFMTPEEFKKKLASFAHTEYNNDRYSNEKLFEEVMKTGKDVFSRGAKEDCLLATERNKLPKHIDILPNYLQRKRVTQKEWMGPMNLEPELDLSSKNDDLFYLSSKGTKIDKKKNRTIIYEDSVQKNQRIDIKGEFDYRFQQTIRYRVQEQWVQGHEYNKNYYKLLKETNFRDLIENSNLPMYIDELYLCAYYWEKYMINSGSQDPAINGRKISQEVMINFVDLCLKEWVFYKEYINKKDYFDQHLRYAGVEYKDNKIYNQNRYNVCILDNAIEPYEELIKMIHESITMKGYQSDMITKPNMQSMNIIIGIGNKPRIDKYPKNCILLNLEQIYTGSVMNNPEYLSFLRKNAYWDYCKTNDKIKDVPVIKFGFSKGNEFINSYNDEKHDIDVIFFGTKHPRRIEIHNQLKERNINVLFLDNCRGQEKIELLRRSKIVLNIHYYKYFEIVRVGFLLNNCRFIISEVSDDDIEWEDLHDGFIRSEYNKLVETVISYLPKQVERKKIAELGYELYKKRIPDLPLPDLSS